LLATNTRYLNELQLAYAERLTALLPAPLSVCYFVASGSEANEVALRLVRAHTKRKDLLVMEHGYHGATTGAVDISPYKWGKGYVTKPDWAHKSVQPDLYRGAHHGQDAADRFADEVDAQIAQLRAEGRDIAAYLCECLPSVGGQVVMPNGFLRRVYAAVRRAGGLCIADDVQTALGRTGDFFFGFEQQGVVPDVLVLGKPLGNEFSV
jgi:4-aminobutyrate aminotransferase-like enzyme